MACEDVADEAKKLKEEKKVDRGGTPSQRARMDDPAKAGESESPPALEVGCNGSTTSTTNSLREVRNFWLGIIAGFKGSHSRLQKKKGAAALNGK